MKKLFLLTLVVFLSACTSTGERKAREQFKQDWPQVDELLLARNKVDLREGGYGNAGVAMALLGLPIGLLVAASNYDSDVDNIVVPITDRYMSSFNEVIQPAMKEKGIKMSFVDDPSIYDAKGWHEYVDLNHPGTSYILGVENFLTIIPNGSDPDLKIAQKMVWTFYDRGGIALQKHATEIHRKYNKERLKNPEQMDEVLRELQAYSINELLLILKP